MNEILQNTNLGSLFAYLREVIAWRFKNPAADFKAEGPALDMTSMETTLVSHFIQAYELSPSESVVLIMTLVPHLVPDFLLDVVSDEFPAGTDLPIFGGVKGKNHRGIIPTGETVQFILAGTQMQKRIDCMQFFSEEHIFTTEEILYLETVTPGEPLMSGKVLLRQESIHLLTTGQIPPPKLSSEFPAERLDTPLRWDDLVLDDKTFQHIKELEVWLHYNEILMEDWEMKFKIKPGYRALFYGPPGTGKTLTASLLGKYTQKPVYRIDLSTVISKYIGETEKHLSNLFDRAANKDWILFFDEADAIFGKRTSVRDAHDKYANQEVSYLLQRVESHPGLVILASNFRDNIDEAFTRRFQSIFEFKTPGVKERMLLWEKNLPERLQLAPEIDLQSISKKYNLTGSNIINIIQYCSLQVLSQHSDTLSLPILLEGIKKEYIKEDRLF